MRVTACKKFNGPKGQYELRKLLHYETHLLGVRQLEPLRSNPMTFTPEDPSQQPSFEFETPAAHPDEQFAVMSVGLGMKLPEVLPRDYAMCEVHFGFACVVRRDRLLEEGRQALDVCGTFVQDGLDRIAKKVGGRMPFTAAEEQAAEAKVQ